MEASEQDQLINNRKSKRRRACSKAELYSVLEALLPFAQTEIKCLAYYVEHFPDDPQHAEDTKQARLGVKAIEVAEQLIAKKTVALRRQQKAFRENQEHTNA
jgi:hypothetical protein